MICPNCGSNNTSSQAVAEQKTTTKTKGFGVIKSCLGWMVMGPVGSLCGMCGMGKGRTKTKTNTRIIHICQDCGRKF